MFRNEFRGLIYEISMHEYFVHMYVSYIHVRLGCHESIGTAAVIFDHISHIRIYKRGSCFIIMCTLTVEKDLFFCITNYEISGNITGNIAYSIGKKNRYRASS